MGITYTDRPARRQGGQPEIQFECKANSGDLTGLFDDEQADCLQTLST